jgi:hypothetical protein
MAVFFVFHQTKRANFFVISYFLATFAAVKRSKRIAESQNNKQYGTENQVYEDARLRQRLHLY